MWGFVFLWDVVRPKGLGFRSLRFEGLGLGDSRQIGPIWAKAL